MIVLLLYVGKLQAAFLSNQNKWCLRVFRNFEPNCFLESAAFHNCPD